MSANDSVAVFDLDGTITRYDTYVHFLIFCLRSKPLRLLASPMLIVYFGMYKAGIRSNHWLKARFLRLVLGGVGQSELNQLAVSFNALTLRKNIKRGALEEIEKLRKEGYEIVLATASFGFYVKSIADSLGVDHLLCSAAAVDSGGRLTGEIDGLNCIGEEKARRLRVLMVERGWSEIDRAYSDHKVDLPLLEMSRVAVVVDPKPATEAVAGRCGYEILRWK